MKLYKRWFLALLSLPQLVLYPTRGEIKGMVFRPCLR